jgi:hypothetical protein
MGWLLAFLFMLIAGLACFLLFNIWKDKIALEAKLQILEPQAAALAPTQVEREKLAASYAALRRRVQGLADADDEKARVIEQSKALADKFNAQLAAAKTQFAERKEAMAAEVARLESQAAARRREIELEISEMNAQAPERKRAANAELMSLEEKLAALRAEHRALSEEAALAELGFYKTRYGFATSQQYKQAIEGNYEKQKAMLTNKAAATCSQQWTVDGSVEKGQKQTDRYLALLVRAFNGECDSAIAKVKATNFQTMENRIIKAFDSLNRLGEMQYCSISTEYRNLRLEELGLEYEHALKLQAEREEQRAIREEMRQQAIAQREIEEAQKQADQEQKRYERATEQATNNERQYRLALEKAQEEFSKASESQQQQMKARLAELESMVADERGKREAAEALAAEAREKKDRAISMAQQTRAGHVYIISNVGSFGTNVYKIGMTRRLDPMDRIWELSDASVPFDFDVHAVIRTDDAPGMETELHQRFASRRMNAVNQKKEFFNVSIEDIATVVRERCGDIELTLIAEAAEYLQSEAFHRENGRSMAASRLFHRDGGGHG